MSVIGRFARRLAPLTLLAFGLSGPALSDGTPGKSNWQSESFSEEAPSNGSCDTGINGMTCSGNHCDNKTLSCSTDGFSYGATRGLYWISEETDGDNKNSATCDLDSGEYIYKLECRGGDCDDTFPSCGTANGNYTVNWTHDPVYVNQNWQLFPEAVTFEKNAYGRLITQGGDGEVTLKTSQHRDCTLVEADDAQRVVDAGYLLSGVACTGSDCGSFFGLYCAYTQVDTSEDASWANLGYWGSGCNSNDTCEFTVGYSYTDSSSDGQSWTTADAQSITASMSEAIKVGKPNGPVSSTTTIGASYGDTSTVSETENVISTSTVNKTSSCGATIDMTGDNIVEAYQWQVQSVQGDRMVVTSTCLVACARVDATTGDIIDPTDDAYAPYAYPNEPYWLTSCKTTPTGSPPTSAPSE